MAGLCLWLGEIGKDCLCCEFSEASKDLCCAPLKICCPCCAWERLLDPLFFCLCCPCLLLCRCCKAKNAPAKDDGKQNDPKQNDDGQPPPMNQMERCLMAQEGSCDPDRIIPPVQQKA